MENKYELPELPYNFGDLAPYISEEQLRLHYAVHHQAYVNNANALLEKLDKARKENSEIDIKATLKELSFNVSGAVMHNLFWQNMERPGKSEPEGKLMEAIENNFGSFERFKMEFSKAGVSVEGSGWVLLVSDGNRLLISQIEKHSVNTYPNFKHILVLDVWEHAYYLDYKNDRQKFIDGFWSVVNWTEAEKRYIAH